MFKKLSTKAWVIIIVSIVLVIALFLTCLITATIKDENRFKYELNEDGASYSIVDIKNAYRGGWFAKKSITVPQTHKGLPVTAIQQIKNLQKTESVILPDGLLEIGASAFFACNITSIEIPDSVTTVGSSAFENCTSLTNVKLPSNFKAIPAAMFRSCFNLAEITLPSSVTSIGVGAFSNCYALETIELPSGVTTIAKEAFSNCRGLTSIELPSRLTSIGDNAFANCYSLIEICNNSGLSISPYDTKNGYVAYNALNVYSNRQGQSFLTHTEDNNVFYDDGEEILFVKHYGNETALTLPSGLNGKSYEIHDYAFYGNSTLEEIVIPSGVTSIKYNAFENCSALQKVTIGDDVTLIQDSAFLSCKQLREVHFGTGIKTIGKRAFFGCTNLAALSLSDGIEIIGQEAFSACSQLTSVAIGKGLKSIGDEAFFNCTNFTELKFGGTKAEWDEVQLGTKWTWDNNSKKRAPSCEKVICSDGEVPVSSVE